MRGHFDDRSPVGRRQMLQLATAGLAAAVLAACRDDRAAGRAPTEAHGPNEVVVTAIDNTFNPQVVEVSAGSTVTWRNGGNNEHDVIPFGDEADDPNWGVTLDDFPPGAEYSHVFTEPGEYEYVCTIHGSEAGYGMIGTIIVT